MISDEATQAAVQVLQSGRRVRRNRRRVVLLVLLGLSLAASAAMLLIGSSAISPFDVVSVLLGQDIPGASYAVNSVRLPRLLLGILVGACFGLGGVTFQRMLKNPLASPDIIGISAGASTAAVFGIIVLGISGPQLAWLAVLAGLGIALLVQWLARGSGTAGGRLILVGIGCSAVMSSLTSFLLGEAPQNDLPLALRWLAGSLNGADWVVIWPLAIAFAVLAPILLLLGPEISNLQLGEDLSSALGMRPAQVRLVLVVVAVGLISFATAASGPIAFVAFLAGPIAARVLGPNGSPMLPAAIVGVLLVLLSDLAGQFLLGRYPVGVVTGVIGAPYLLYLIVQSNRRGASL